MCDSLQNINLNTTSLVSQLSISAGCCTETTLNCRVIKCVGEKSDFQEYKIIVAYGVLDSKYLY